MAQPLNRLREIREQKGFTLERLATAVGATKSQLQRLEVGDTGLDISWMQRLGKALGVKPSEFLIDEDAEFRLDPAESAYRAVLEPLVGDERDSVLRIAVEMTRLLRRMSPRKGAVVLQGDPLLAAQFADVFNEMPEDQRLRALEFMRAANAFGRSPALQAAE